LLNGEQYSCPNIDTVSLDANELKFAADAEEVANDLP
jgi:hypothetical protein